MHGVLAPQQRALAQGEAAVHRTFRQLSFQ